MKHGIFYSLTLALLAAADETPQDVLLQTTWVCTEFYDGSSLVPVTTLSPPTLRFDEDGGFGGGSGCNRYSGTYTDLTDDSVSLQINGRRGRRGCSGDLKLQENAFRELLDGLDTGVEYAILIGVGKHGLYLLKGSDDSAEVIAKFEEDTEPTILDIDYVATTALRKREY